MKRKFVFLLQSSRSKLRLVVPKGEHVFVLGTHKGDYIGVIEGEKGMVGFIRRNECSRVFRDIRKLVDVPTKSFREYMKKREYKKKELEGVVAIQKWYRRNRLLKFRENFLKKLQKRIDLQYELVDNDTRYLNFLHAVKILYYVPLQRVLSEDSHDLVFSNFAQIVVVAEEVNNALKKDGIFGLDEVVDKLSTNSKFVSNYSTAMIEWKKVVKENNKDRKTNSNADEFCEIVETAMDDPRCRGLNLQNLLIKPFQRLVTYKNLIETYLRATPAVSFQHKRIKGILKRLSRICYDIDAEKKKKEGQRKLLKLGVFSVNNQDCKRELIEEKDLTVAINDGKFFSSHLLSITDMLYLNDENNNPVIFYYALCEIVEYAQRKHMLTISSVNSKLVIKGFKKVNEAFLRKIYDNVRKTKIIVKRRHGLNINESFKQQFENAKKDDSEVYGSKLEENRKIIEAEEKDISYRKKYIKYVHLLVGAKLVDIKMNVNRIIKSKKNINQLLEENKKIKEGKKQNLMVILNFLSKFRECLNNDINSFYRIFKNDYMFCSNEIEKLKKTKQPLDLVEDEEDSKIVNKLLRTPNLMVVKKIREYIKKIEVLQKDLNEKNKLFEVKNDEQFESLVEGKGLEDLKTMNSAYYKQINILKESEKKLKEEHEKSEKENTSLKEQIALMKKELEEEKIQRKAFEEVLNAKDLKLKRLSKRIGMLSAENYDEM